MKSLLGFVAQKPEGGVRAGERVHTPSRVPHPWGATSSLAYHERFSCRGGEHSLASGAKEA